MEREYNTKTHRWNYSSVKMVPRSMSRRLERPDCLINGRDMPWFHLQAYSITITIKIWSSWSRIRSDFYF